MAALPGSTVVAEIRITPGAGGVSGYGISLQFDDDLTLQSASEFLPTGFSFNFTPGPGSATADRVNTFEAATLGAGPTTGTFAIGRVTFLASDPKDDGIDVIAGLFNGGIDGVFDNAGFDLANQLEFAGASVFVPEPGALLLIGGGIAGLAAKRRRWER